ncbi:MAG: hypothetical protein IT431_17375 [Phycisphaerales bacterium]|nr:hypothetical protein [Phycisphaerales bacterium]
MPSANYQALLRAAERLLEAREDQMLTSEEWDALRDAVVACTPARAPRAESYAVDRGGALVRSVTPRRGEPYQHRCLAETFQAVAHAIDEAAGGAFTLEEIVEAEGLPFSQVATALAFLKERGCVITVGRRSYAPGPGVFEDAMTEYHALREAASG